MNIWPPNIKTEIAREQQRYSFHEDLLIPMAEARTNQIYLSLFLNYHHADDVLTACGTKNNPVKCSQC